MSGQSRALRAIAVAAIAAAPLSAVKASAAVETGDARANGPGLALENTGGNVEIGKGRSETRTVVGGPIGPVAGVAPGARTVAPVVPKPVTPANTAAARAKAIVDAARARAQAQIDEARRQAEEAVREAGRKSDEARARSDAQADAARTQAENSGRSGAYNYDD